MSPATILELPRALTRFVKHVRVTENLGPVRYERIPDGEAEIVIQKRAEGAMLHLVGLRTTTFAKRPEPLRAAIVVRFHAAGAYPFFGRPMSELTDRFATLASLWGAEAARLEDTLDRTPRACADTLVSVLGARLADAKVFEPASSIAVRRAVSLVHAAPVLPSVKGLAADVGLSERQLRRAFDDVVGVGPKHYLRIARFDRVLKLASTGADWSALARHAGYSDQGHLIGEFREMTRETPAAFVARRAADRA